MLLSMAPSQEKIANIYLSGPWYMTGSNQSTVSTLISTNLTALRGGSYLHFMAIETEAYRGGVTYSRL